MRIIICALLLSLLLPSSFASPSSPQSQWLTLTSRLQLNTPFGEIKISPSDYLYESRLLIDEAETVPPIIGYLNISYVFSTPGKQAVLVSIHTGEESCPTHYRWLLLKSESYVISPQFGSCSSHIRVDKRGKTLILQTPNPDSPEKTDEYQYDGQHLVKKIR
ncbi:hypothetical protein L1889_08920 [Paenalcaligenes niemegkensis]|uniref:hypothetical protein n=1 Tax=Paenalcaligenes niemegkensis TaxID=2895469 RepID=UPI001EE7A88E|nr:hypothetical protein [Paenalcaligenes niemegkensis]MCQ9616810.1 hypothetical protein [Paenalcaligenes niemegkensis]